MKYLLILCAAIAYWSFVQRHYEYEESHFPNQRLVKRSELDLFVEKQIKEYRRPVPQADPVKYKASVRKDNLMTDKQRAEALNALFAAN